MMKLSLLDSLPRFTARMNTTSSILPPPPPNPRFDTLATSTSSQNPPPPSASTSHDPSSTSSPPIQDALTRDFPQVAQLSYVFSPSSSSSLIERTDFPRAFPLFPSLSHTRILQSRRPTTLVGRSRLLRSVLEHENPSSSRVGTGRFYPNRTKLGIGSYALPLSLSLSFLCAEVFRIGGK